ncbi:helix-turn-helix domain-containing protein [Paraburkholderia acidisoli]|uniref:Addiction module antidote protein n=1 Tax=Paraburkholderia acidisoli TaxID=2571748 RepID=A0A7Z2GG00_9BURK|nr:hypothetical protein [Paraburkholderia acidisoli]QGZ61092.1 hypothetical protein FAZ98_04720 [Paraburkholderia acidisoli]
MALKTTAFDAADVLDSPEAQFEFLRLAYEEGDAERIDESIEIVTRARALVAAKNCKP